MSIPGFRFRSIATLVAALAVASLLLAQSARAYIYWGEQGQGPAAVGRANLDGSLPHNFVFGSGFAGGCGVAVDNAHLYYADDHFANLARAGLTGGAAQPFFISTNVLCGVAVDSSYIYWPFQHSIGRASLDGSGVDPNFIPSQRAAQPPDLPCGIAVDATRIYWANLPDRTIGVANLDGSGVNENFISTPDSPCGVAVDGTHIYWGQPNSIGRADLNGLNPNPTFIPAPSNGCGLAVDSTYLYWTPGAGMIGRASLDGSSVNGNFIPGLSGACGVAVDAGRPANTFVTSHRAACLKGCTVVLIRVDLPDPGEVTIRPVQALHRSRGATASKNHPALIKQTRAVASAAGRVTLKLKLSVAGKSQLKKEGRVRARVLVTFTPTGGTPASKKISVTFKPRKH